MKKLVLLASLLFAAPALAIDQCETQLKKFGEEVTAAGMEMVNYQQIDEVTAMLEFASKDGSLREGFILTKHQGLENALSKNFTIKASGSCEYKGENFFYVRIAADIGVQAESLPRSIESGKK